MKKIIGLVLVAGIVLSCNIPAPGPSDSQVATVAALTVQAALNTTPNTQPLASPTAIIVTSGVTITATYSKPVVSVGDVTNCRAGPGVNYERVTQILPADSVEIIGFFPPNYWVVSTSAGDCWVSGEFSTPAGSYATVPTVTAPPTPSGNGPGKISLQKWDVQCNYATEEANITIIWTDKDSESGYRILRNGEPIAELPANSAQFKETITLKSGESVTYNVVVFNAIGSTSSSTITLSC